MAALPAARIGEPMSFEERYQVHAIKQCTPTTLELWLRPVGGRLSIYRRARAARAPLLPRAAAALVLIAIAPLADGLMSLSVTHVPGGELAVGFRAHAHDHEVALDRAAVRGARGARR
jgi:hypothetical protein